MRVGILGCTGLVGRTYRALLHKHPFFQLTYLGASQASVDEGIESASAIEAIANRCDIVFSALPSDIAPRIETELAHNGVFVISGSSAFRNEPDIPVIIPEINPQHLEWLEVQQKNRGFSGGIICKPNCTLQAFLLPLWPLYQRYGLKRLIVTNLQALSGGGRDLLNDERCYGDITPFIPGEEEKSISESRKILSDMSIDIAAQCLRVPVQHGHLACIHALFATPIQLDECLELWRNFPAVMYNDDPYRPTPVKDCMQGEGMTVTIGRARLFNERELQCISLAHNLIRGAAGGGVTIGELLCETRFLNRSAQTTFFKK